MPPARAVTAQDSAFLDGLVRCAVAALLLANAAVGYADSDIWGHMSIGLDTLRQGHLLRVDPYSFTHDQVWVNHEWLWEVATAWLYQRGGLGALLVMRAVLIGLVLWLVDRATRQAPGWVRLVTLCLVAIDCVGQWRSTRPQIASLAFYAVLLTNIEAWWLPALFGLWANVHAGWLIGLVALGSRALVIRNRRTSTLAVLSVIATLLNPYGVGLWTTTIGGLVRSRGFTDLTEWSPVWALSAGQDTLWLWLATAAAIVAISRRARFGWWDIAWTCATMVAAANTRRLLAFAAVTAAMVVVARYEPPCTPVRVVWTPARRAVAAALAGILLVVALVRIRPGLTCFPPLTAWNAPEPGAVAFLRATPVSRAVVHFDFGEYAIFHLRDRLRVSVDNRHYTVYSNAALEASDRFVAGHDPDYPDRIGADAVWLFRDNAVPLKQMEERGWHRRFDGPRTVILLREAGPVVRGEWNGATPCFPNP